MTAFDFSPLLRSTIGFERLMKNFDRVMSADATAEHYPPCNIVKTGEHTYRIEMAVAGFAEEDLAIEAKGDELVIAGKVQGQDDSRVFLHRGIATRQFRRTFPPRRACEGRRREARERHALRRAGERGARSAEAPPDRDRRRRAADHRSGLSPRAALPTFTQPDAGPQGPAFRMRVSGPRRCRTPATGAPVAPRPGDRNEDRSKGTAHGEEAKPGKAEGIPGARARNGGFMPERTIAYAPSACRS